MDKITKISDIKKVIRCPCRKGKIKLRMFYIDPKNGKVALSYSRCGYSFCPYRKGLLRFTDIVIPELILER